MAANDAVFYNEGNTVDHTPGSALLAGDVVELNSDNAFLGVAMNDIAANALGALRIWGIFNIVKKTSTDTWTAGDILKWDGTAILEGLATNVGGHVAAADSANGDTKALVKINARYDAHA